MLPALSFGLYRASESVVFNSGQKMELRAFYFIRALTKALTYYYINRSQRQLLIAIENNRFGGPIIICNLQVYKAFLISTFQGSRFIPTAEGIANT